MTDIQQQPTESSDELETLKARADMMGIKYHPATGVDKLKRKIEMKLEGNSSEDDKEETVKSVSNNESVPFITHQEFMEQTIQSRKIEANRLVRCRITCMNPNKKEWEGEIISVGSAKLGTFKKYVKFNTEDGYHIPKIIYDYLKEKKCSLFYTAKDHLGQPIRKSKSINEFNIEVLPPLTPKELKDLAQRQAMAKGEE